MILMRLPRQAMIADQCFAEIFPMARYVRSPAVAAGISTKSGSSHNACASTKPIPCFFLFPALFAGSNSNSMV
jgi:hypothetical protein